MRLHRAYFFLFYVILIPFCMCASDCYYDILGINKNADLREIRRAFKKLAVTLHPDKNPDNPKAHETFIKVVEAYEILKDPQQRSQYDRFGKTKFQNNAPPKYHSYTYYRDQFGIYDDDPLIATLYDSDFESNLQDNAWFINFYSPRCSHCHTLAPAWRKLAESLQGVVKIGAVNCADDRILCMKLGIQSFPTLLYYSAKAKIVGGGIKYTGERLAFLMERFVMEHLSPTLVVTPLKALPSTEDTPWLLFLCSPDIECVQHETRLKVAAVLKGLVSVGLIEDKSVIKKINNDKSTNILLIDNTETTHIEGNDFINITNDVLHVLPEATKVDTEGFGKIRSQLRLDLSQPWLLCFTLGLDTQTTILLKKFRASLEGFNIGEINCARNSGLCASLHIVKYPTWAILKKGGAFEIHTGRPVLHAIENFAKETQKAINLHALSPPDIQQIMSSGSPWIIGWLLTSCTPCKKMLPALRTASSHFTPDVIQFGTVDCALHQHVCSQFNVYNFPTTTIYNGSDTIKYIGDGSVSSIVEFIQMLKTNYVVTLTADNFQSEVGSKSESDMYVVEYYAPWCGPCQRLQPDWRKLAKKLSHLGHVRFGGVNCEVEREICMSQGIKSYPTIRLYPTGSHGLNTMAIYTNYQRDVYLLQKWVLDFLPPISIDLTSENFHQQLLYKVEDRIWIVLFYAPWCKHCHEFEPEFIAMAQKLKDHVVAGKVNCQREGALCDREDVRLYPTLRLYQRVNGITNLANGIDTDTLAEEEMTPKIKALLAKAYVTPVEHDEL